MIRNALCTAVFAALVSPAVLAGDIDKFDSSLRERLVETGPLDALIVLDARADPLPLDRSSGYLGHRRAWVETLRATAEHSQADLRAWLDARDVPYRAFWIANTVLVHADGATLTELAARGDVTAIYADPAIAASLPKPEPIAQKPQQTLAIAWGVNKIRAPMVWAAGITGQGVTIAGQDTGYDWTHPALKPKYRGWNGNSANHAYHWHDGVQAAIVGGSSCGYDSPAPCDDDAHGTHTMGTMIGADGNEQIGVAPGARWIGCRNMDQGVGRPSTYLDCMQWFLAPTDSAGGNPDPDRAPDVISNSWGCPTAPPPDGEGCTPPAILKDAVENLVNGGIFFVVAAGNSGSACQTINDPPAIYAASFVVGSTGQTDGISDFSSRGPVSGLANVKPDVVAPGELIRSSYLGGGYVAFGGTSMASPHVAGTAALLMSVNPALKGNPTAVAAILRSTAVHLDGASVNQTCGGITPTTFPNPVQGAGRLDAYAAFRIAETIFVDGYESP